MEQPFEKLPESCWDKPSPDKHKLSIYCGFDAQRLHQDLQLNRESSPRHLFIHSCQRGRLIKKNEDARQIVGLSSYQVDFAQGLTIIVNDITGNLPLTPTKDDIALSKRENGEIHQRNLLCWTGAVVDLFWNYHKNRLGGKSGNNVKELLGSTIHSYALEEQASDKVHIMTEVFEDSNFSMFQNMQWERVQVNFDNRWKI
ncbi:hypothetical protein IV203_019757 [Nitzschia inconspicua]|uniref:Uncharacterized protein n=1 Tax=Nitzschia inconspicua TaxID=303405 RepID=A0A9K3Q4L6_9STRA|nr:hypothetical protein IV203_019757 [Nitzschia inconspicua]